MPKITAKEEMPEGDFQKALKRSRFIDQGSFMGTRRFAVLLSDGRFIGQVPGIYEGRFGRFNARLTLKHLQNVSALAEGVAKKNYAPNSTASPASAPASSDQLDLVEAAGGAA